MVVVGAGAAGLLAATRAAERGRKTLLVEKNKRPGVKILISGGTRCNLTQATDSRGIVKAFGEQGKFLHSALAGLGPRELVAMIEAEGVPTKIEPTGKIFPVSDKAADVLGALVRRLERSGCSLAAGEAVTAIDRDDGRFLIATEKRQVDGAARLAIHHRWMLVSRLRNNRRGLWLGREIRAYGRSRQARAGSDRDECLLGS